jgi:hypothetical protein
MFDCVVLADIHLDLNCAWPAWTGQQRFHALHNREFVAINIDLNKAWRLDRLVGKERIDARPKNYLAGNGRELRFLPRLAGVTELAAARSANDRAIIKLSDRRPV